jgi:hypothetical protein
MTDDWDRQRDIAAEGQRAALYYQKQDPATVARFAAWLREREHLATPGLRDTAELLEALAAENARLRALVERAQLCVPECQEKWHSDARAALAYPR